MASSCLTKSKKLITQNLKSNLIHLNSSIANNSLSHSKLIHSISSKTLPVHRFAATYSPINSSIRCFESIYIGRKHHSATSLSNQPYQTEPYKPTVTYIMTLPPPPASSAAAARWCFYELKDTVDLVFLMMGSNFLYLNKFETPRQELDFPGGKVKFTPKLIFTSKATDERVNCFRVLDENGQPMTDSDSLKMSKELAVKMYRDMVTLQVMDTIFYESQRQGRISFYLTTIGEEAINIASAAALHDNDFVFPQYREPGVLLWRGFTLQEFANELFVNKYDNGKGRQTPMHYGSKKHNYLTVSSPVATQLPHAVGAAYSMKMEKQDSCTVTYFGDGGSSTAEFHAALNFAAVMEVPVIFFCRNNGWAISTPVDEQFRSDGVVVRGKAYGVPSIRIDGNDALAVYSAVFEARKMAIQQQTPVLIEALTYRVGHHTTSDDSTKYRSVDEIEWWREHQNPVKRFRKWVETKGWWSHEAESEHRMNIRKQLSQVIQAAERIEKPPIADLFNDVYDVLPKNLNEQEVSLRKSIIKQAQDYPSDVPV